MSKFGLYPFLTILTLLTLIKHLMERSVVVATSITITTTFTLQEFVDYASILGLNEQCNMEDENVLETVVQDVSTLSKNNKNKSEIIKWFLQVGVGKGAKFCNKAEGFLCSERTQQCECGLYNKKLLYPYDKQRTDFTLEKDVDGLHHCRWTEGTYCLPQSVNLKVGFPSHLKCQQGTECISMTTGTKCTVASYNIYMATKFPSMSKIDTMRLAEDRVTGKICSCQEIEEDYYSEGEGLNSMEEVQRQ